MSMYASHERGGRTGSGGVASSAEINADRRERMRQIAEETIDLSKDPYFMRNHLGTFILPIIILQIWYLFVPFHVLEFCSNINEIICICPYIILTCF